MGEPAEDEIAIDVDLNGTAETVPPEEIPGERVGRYQLRYEIARGGMATVYLAVAAGPAGFEKLVALKRIHKHLAKETEYVEMFLDEARISARIQHRNVCSVLDFGEADGEYFMTMEYLLGEPLNRVLKALKKTPQLAKDRATSYIVARVMAEVAEGLHGAHELRDAGGESLGIVHRDISPANLFVTYHGGVKVVDFGIAQAADKVHHTETGKVKGKFAYLSPEALHGKELDRRTDIWALGVTFWESLTLQRLFRGKTAAETIRQVLDDDIPKPSQVRPGLPTDFDAIVAKAIARDRDDRYLTARQFAEDINQALSRASRPTPLSEVGDWMNQLFPGGEARKRQLMELARLPQAAVPQIPSDENSSSAVHTMDAAIEVDELTGSRSNQWLKYAGVVLVTLLVVAGGYAALSGGDPAPGADPSVNDSPGLETAETPATAQPEPEIEEPVEPTPPEPSDEVEVVAATVEPESVESEEPTMRRGGRSMRRGSMAAEMATMEEPTMAVATTGRVNVVTPGGWAEIRTLGGRRLGTSPATVRLPSGTQQIRILPFGQPPGQTVSVDVPEGGTTPLVVRVSQ